MRARGLADPFLYALAAALLLAGGGLPACAETLEEALAKTHRTNPEIRAEQALVRATDELAPQALVNWRPTITGTGEIGWERLYNNTYTTADGSRQTRNPKSAKLVINEYLYRGGRTIAATSVAENKILAARARLMAVEGKVLSETAAAYLRLLMQREIAAITSESEAGIAGELAGTRRRFDVGERTKTDVSQAETRHAKAVAERINAESDLAQAEAVYRTLVGEDAGQLTLPPVPPGLPARRETAIALALDANYGIAAALYDEKAAKEGIDLAKGEMRPTLAVQGAVGRDYESSTADSRIDDATIKLTLSMPFYDGGLAASKTRQARQLYSQASINLEKAKRDAAEAAGKSWDVYNLASERIRVNEARVAAAETALANILREQSFGTRSLIDVLDARQDLLDSRTALARARSDMRIAAFQLKQAIGEMTAQRLALNGPAYDPAQHYEEVHGKWIGTRSATDKERGNTVEPRPDGATRAPAPLPSDIGPKLPPAENQSVPPPSVETPPVQENAPEPISAPPSEADTSGNASETTQPEPTPLLEAKIDSQPAPIAKAEVLRESLPAPSTAPTAQTKTEAAAQPPEPVAKAEVLRESLPAPSTAPTAQTKTEAAAQPPEPVAKAEVLRESLPAPSTTPIAQTKPEAAAQPPEPEPVGKTQQDGLQTLSAFESEDGAGSPKALN